MESTNQHSIEGGRLDPSPCLFDQCWVQVIACMSMFWARWVESDMIRMNIGHTLKTLNPYGWLKVDSSCFLKASKSFEDDSIFESLSFSLDTYQFNKTCTCFFQFNCGNWPFFHHPFYLLVWFPTSPSGSAPKTSSNKSPKPNSMANCVVASEGTVPGLPARKKWRGFQVYKLLGGEMSL